MRVCTYVKDRCQTGIKGQHVGEVLGCALVEVVVGKIERLEVLIPPEFLTQHSDPSVAYFVAAYI
jgi:hypothetical protein